MYSQESTCHFSKTYGWSIRNACSFRIVKVDWELWLCVGALYVYTSNCRDKKLNTNLQLSYHHERTSSTDCSFRIVTVHLAFLALCNLSGYFYTATLRHCVINFMIDQLSGQCHVWHNLEMLIINSYKQTNKKKNKHTQLMAGYFLQAAADGSHSLADCEWQCWPPEQTLLPKTRISLRNLS